MAIGTYETEGNQLPHRMNPERSCVEFWRQGEQEQGFKRPCSNADLSTAGRQQSSSWLDPAPARRDDDTRHRAWCVQGQGAWSNEILIRIGLIRLLPARAQKS